MILAPEVEEEAAGVADASGCVAAIAHRQGTAVAGTEDVATDVDDADASHDELLHDAELQVRSYISVREKYKKKLNSMVEALYPSTFASTAEGFANSPLKLAAAASSSSSSSPKPPRARSGVHEPVNLQRGKEMHVVGDWLLLMRAASVDVVESVQEWRRLVHDGKVTR